MSVVFDNKYCVLISLGSLKMSLDAELENKQLQLRLNAHGTICLVRLMKASEAATEGCSGSPWLLPNS